MALKPKFNSLASRDHYNFRFISLGIDLNYVSAASRNSRNIAVLSADFSSHFYYTHRSQTEKVIRTRARRVSRARNRRFSSRALALLFLSPRVVFFPFLTVMFRAKKRIAPWIGIEIRFSRMIGARYVSHRFTHRDSRSHVSLTY